MPQRRVGECQPAIKFTGNDTVIQQGLAYFQALMRFQVTDLRGTKHCSKLLHNRG